MNPRNAVGQESKCIHYCTKAGEHFIHFTEADTAQALVGTLVHHWHLWEQSVCLPAYKIKAVSLGKKDVFCGEIQARRRTRTVLQAVLQLHFDDEIRDRIKP